MPYEHTMSNPVMYTHTFTEKGNHVDECGAELLNWFSISCGPPGMTLTLLQLSLKFVGLIYIPAFTKIYQGTLDGFPGFVFMLSSILTVVAMIPIRFVLVSVYPLKLSSKFGVSSDF